MLSIRRAVSMSAACLLTLAFLLTGSSVATAGTGTAPTSVDHRCEGWGGVLDNFGRGAVGGITPPILGATDLGRPYVDNGVVRADSSVAFASYGFCGAQVAFQMQTKVCGTWGCHWKTRNHGRWEFLWQHDDTGKVAQQVTMGCRKGEHSYRVHMEVVGLRSDAEEGKGRAPGVVGVTPANQSSDGPVVKLTCN